MRVRLELLASPRYDFVAIDRGGRGPRRNECGVAKSSPLVVAEEALLVNRAIVIDL